MAPVAPPVLRVLQTVALGMLAQGCDPQVRADQVSLQHVGDTLIVRSPASGVDGPVTLQEIRRIDLAALDVGRVDAGAFGPNGTLWLLDGASRSGASIRVLDATGAPRAVAGREGGGPGEYRAPVRLFRLADGSMLVKEMSTTRAVRFDENGRALSTMELPPIVATGWVVTPDTVGGWFITAVFEANTPTRVGRFGWLHFDGRGVVMDTVHPPSHLLTEPTPDGIAPGRIRTIGRDGAVLTTTPGPNVLYRYTRDGRAQVLTWPGNPPEYQAGERRDIQVVSDRMKKLFGLPPEPLPRHKQPSHRILTDSAQWVWAHLAAEGVRIPDEELPKDQDNLGLTMRWRERERWAAFDREGALRFILDVPPNVTIVDRQTYRVLGIEIDDEGLQSLVEWKVIPGR